MGKCTTKKQAEQFGKAVVEALKAGGVITAEQAKNATVVVGGRKKKLRADPRQPHDNKHWKRHCHHPSK